MKTLLTIFFFNLLFLASSAQEKLNKDTYATLSGGRVTFGTGDVFGYSFAVEASKNMIKKSKPGLDKLLLGGELIFESGTKNPVIDNPTSEQFFEKSFRHTANTIFWPKISYYPFAKAIPGFNIQLGPTIGYSQRSSEQRAQRVGNVGEFTRISTLQFDNDFVYGYRISTGIDIPISNKYSTGFRVDWSNNNDGDINTLLGLKLGIKL